MGERPFDRIDLQIIAELQKNARISNKDLAATVHLAPSSCLERVRALRERGVFGGFHAEVTPETLGIGLTAVTQIRLRHHTREVVDAFAAHCVDLPEVTRLLHVSGATDFLVELAVRDANHLRDFLMDAFTTWPEVAHLETAIVFQTIAKPVLPQFVDTEE